MKQEMYRALLVSAFLSLCLSGSARPQQDTSASKEPQDKDTNSAQKSDSQPGGVASQSLIPAGNVQGADSAALQIRAMNGVKPLPAGRVSPFQLGPIYLRSADFYQSVETISVSNQPNTLFESVSIFRTNLVLDHSWKISRLAVQYQPRLTVISGRAQTDTSNLTGAWNTLFAVSPRLAIGFKNGFGYYGQQAQFDGLNLQGDLGTGALVQSHFLDGGGHFLNDRSELAIRYLLSPRNRLEVTPFFEYYSASGGQTVTGSKSPGAEIGFARLLSPTKTLAFGYTVRDTQFENLLPRTLYQTVDTTYSQQVGPTWRYSIMVGVTRSSTSVGPSQVTTTVDFNLIKAFRESTLAFRYDRGQALGLQITNGFADRFDASYERPMLQRTKAILGAGYYREFLSATNTSGFYSSSGLSYQIANRWFLQTVYTFKHQQSGGAAIATGHLHFVSFGIRWEPGWRPATSN